MSRPNENTHNLEGGLSINNLDEYRKQILNETHYFDWEGFSFLIRNHSKIKKELSIPLEKVYIHTKIRLLSKPDTKKTHVKKGQASIANAKNNENLAPTVSIDSKDQKSSLKRSGNLGIRDYDRYYTNNPIFDKIRLKTYLGGADDLTQKVYPAHDNIVRISVLEALKKYKRMVIWGKPGSGKSTSLRHLYRISASDTNGPIPILIDLRDLATYFGSGGHKSIQDFALGHMCYRGKPIGKLLSENQPILWLIDGLDESYGYKSKIIQQLIHLPGDIVLTSRYVSQAKSKLENFTHFETSDFSQKDIDNYLYRWFCVFSENYGLDSEKVEQQVVRIKNTIDSLPYLQDLVKSPMMLTFLVILFSKKHPVVEKPARDHPFQKAQLLKIIVEDLLDSWEQSKRPIEGAEGKTAFTLGALHGANARRVAKKSFYIIGWYLHITHSQGREDYYLTRKSLAEYLKQSLNDKDAKSSAESVIDFWRDTGLLIMDVVNGVEYIAFRHIFFQEFATAKGLALAWEQNKKLTWKFLCSKLHSPSWQEPFLMMGGFLDKDRNDINIITRYLLSGVSPFERVLHRDFSLAAKLFAEGAPLKSKIKIQILKRLKWLLCPPVISYIFPQIITFFFGFYIFTKSIIYATNECFVLYYRFLFYRTGKPFPLELEDVLRQHAMNTNLNFIIFLIFIIMWCMVWFSAAYPIKLILKFPKRIWKRKLHKQNLFELCAKIGSPTVPILKKIFISSFRSTKMCVSAGIALGKIGDQETKQILINAISKGENSAVAGLLEMGNCDELNQLVSMLENENSCQNPIIVARVLGLLHREEGISYLGRVSSISNHKQRIDAIKALDEIGSIETVPYLIKAAEDKNTQVVSEAIHSLSRISNLQALPQFVEIASDRSCNVGLRKAAVSALGIIGNPEAVPFLMTVLNDTSSRTDTRVAAVESLGRIGGNGVSHHLIKFLKDEKEQSKIHDAIIRALKQVGDSTSISFLSNFYSEEDRIEQAEVLVHSNNQQITEYLKKVLKDKKKWSPYTRNKVAIAMGKNGDPEALPCLIEGWLDSASIKALGQIGDFKGFFPILKNLRKHGSYFGDYYFFEAEKALIKIVNNCNDIKKLQGASRYLWRLFALGRPFDSLCSNVLELASDRLEYLKVEKKIALNPFTKKIGHIKGAWENIVRLVVFTLLGSGATIGIGILTNKIQAKWHFGNNSLVILILAVIILPIIIAYHQNKNK